VIGERPDCLHMDLFTEELRRRKLGDDDILFVDGFLLFQSPEICELLDIKVPILISIIILVFPLRTIPKTRLGFLILKTNFVFRFFCKYQRLNVGDAGRQEIQAHQKRIMKRYFLLYIFVIRLFNF
jgi:hypothetical protein